MISWSTPVLQADQQTNWTIDRCKKKNILGEGGKKYTRLTLLLNFLILAFTEFWLTYVIAMFLNEGSLTATAFVAGKISIFLLEMFMLCYL